VEGARAREVFQPPHFLAAVVHAPPPLRPVPMARLHPGDGSCLSFRPPSHPGDGSCLSFRPPATGPPGPADPALRAMAAPPPPPPPPPPARAFQPAGGASVPPPGLQLRALLEAEKWPAMAWRNVGRLIIEHATIAGEIDLASRATRAFQPRGPSG
jgi:hypothetical protein